ncbi:hypothetical protein HEK616_31870 [Streptomyces nigrescens]|uniref:Uncharacterized protein n=1 Tax=Streptomyces nigrescens TaxID=1920 RepID=A0ABM7ZTW5_STRNI|nr:hypothetical protein HEK616_31870 [Streptomyces nigrescens]
MRVFPLIPTEGPVCVVGSGSGAGQALQGPRIGLGDRSSFRRAAEAYRPVVRCGDTGADGTVVSSREPPG